MDEDLVALRWNNHLATLSQLLYSLREEESLIDVTLACDGKLFAAHKFVLSMCSEYFKEMFTSNPCKHPIVYLKDVKCEDMEALLDFMYRGVVHIPQDSLTALLKTAEGLQIRGLGLFAREANNTGEGNSGNNTSSTDRPASSAASLENSIMMSPDRRRTHDLEVGLRDEDGGMDSSLVGFSDGEIEDGGSFSHTPNSKRMKSEEPQPAPGPIPDLPRVSEDTLDLGGGVTISANDYFKLRRNSANRYVNDLLRYFFPMEVLASSSLTGGECYANKEKGPSNKNQLDPRVIRVITHDAIRNFPTITEKQVRNAIRRKLNTESRIYRSQGKVPCKRNGTSPRRKSRTMESPRALVSIEKPDREKDKGPALGSMVTPNVTVEKSSSKEVRRSSYTSPNLSDKSSTPNMNPVRVKWPADLSLSDDHPVEVAAKSSTTSSPEHFTSPRTAPTPTLVTAAAAASAAVVTSTASSSSTSSSSADKSFKVGHDSSIKSELPAATQYLPQPGVSIFQEYSYPVMPPHVSQAYLPHHMATADPTYLRRLEMSQGAPHPSALSYSYPHATLPTSESMDLHM